MRRRKTFRTLVIALALAIFGITAVCPGQCVFAAPEAPADDCHGHGEAPAPDASSSLPCCPSLVALKLSPAAGVGTGAPVLLPAPLSVDLSPQTAPPVVSRSAFSHSPPSTALYLRSHALLI